MSQTSITPATLGKYQIRGILGRGAMGTVYDAWDPLIGRRVAIKTVRLLDADDAETQEGLARFKNEAQAAGRLSHPNIVAVYDYGESDETAYIVMEFIEGSSLKQRLAMREPLSVTDSVGIMEQMLAGLRFSHAKGVIHRDIKPANVMLTGDGQVKLADFGIARIESSVVTQAGTMLGTPAYMSPEQLMGQTVDARSDLYAAGVVLFQLLTGERPYEGGLTAIMHKALNTEPPRPSEISVTAPPALDPVVARAMAKRPADRYPDAAAFARAMREAFEASAGSPLDLGLDADCGATIIVPSSGGRAAVAPIPPPGAARVRTTPPRAAPMAAPVPVRPPGPVRRRSPALLGGSAIALLALIGGGEWIALHFHSRASDSTVTPGTSTPGSAIPAKPPSTTATVPNTGASTGQQAGAEPQPSAGQQPAGLSQVGAGQHKATGEAGRPPAPAYSDGLPPSRSSPGPSAPVSPGSPPASASSATAPGSAANLEPPATTSPTAGEAMNSRAPVEPPPVAASVDLALVRDTLALLAAGARCALPRFDVSANGHVSVGGLVTAGQPDAALRTAVHNAAPGLRVSWGIRGIIGPYCDVLDTIRPIALAGSAPLGLVLKDSPPEATHLKAHDLVLPVVTMPDFPAYLVVDYISHDGSVAHLYPIPGLAAPASASRATVRLGNTAKDKVEVGPPYGTDMIVATASSVPLFNGGSVRDDETLQTYLPALQAAIEAARGRGAKLTSRALVVETVEN